MAEPVGDETERRGEEEAGGNGEGPRHDRIGGVIASSYRALHGVEADQGRRMWIGSK